MCQQLDLGRGNQFHKLYLGSITAFYVDNLETKYIITISSNSKTIYVVRRSENVKYVRRILFYEINLRFTVSNIRVKIVNQV